MEGKAIHHQNPLVLADAHLAQLSGALGGGGVFMKTHETETDH